MLCRSSKTSSVLLWSTNKILVSGLGYLWTLCWSCSGAFPVDPFYRKLHHRQGAKIVFYSLDQQIFWSSLIKARHKVIFGWQFRPLPDFVERVEIKPRFLCATALGLVLTGRGGRWPGRTLGEAQLWQAPGSSLWSRMDVGPCFLQEQAPSTSLRKAAPQAGQKPCDSMNEALLDFLESGLAVLKEKLQNSWRKAETFWNL